jgi:hypothetical protein
MLVDVNKSLSKPTEGCAELETQVQAQYKTAASLVLLDLAVGP